MKGFSPEHGDFNIRFSFIIILVVGFFLRAWGIYFYGIHPDEYLYLPRALKMLAFRDFNPHYFINPPFLIYIHVFLMIGYFSICKLIGIISSTQDFKDLYLASPASFYITARYLNVIIGTSSIALLYLIAKKMFNKVVGLAACTLLSVSFLHVRDSHYAVNDIPATFFILAAYYFIVKLFLETEYSDYIWAGLFIGISIATKYNSGIIIFPFLLAHFLSSKQKDTRKLLVGSCFGALGFLAFCPWIIISPKEFFDGFLTQAKYGAQPWFGASEESTYFLYLKTLLWGYGFLPVLLLVPGIIALFNQRRTLCLIMAFPLIYYLVMCQMKLFFVRFAIPMIPFLCLISGFGIFATARWISSSEKNTTVFVILMAVCFQGILFSALHNKIVTAKDTRITAREWIVSHIPPRSNIIMEDPAPDLKDYTTGGILNCYKIYNIEKYLTKENIDSFKTQGLEYVVVSEFNKKRFYTLLDEHNERRKFYNSLDKIGMKLVTIKSGEGDIPFYFDEIYSPFWNIFLLKRPGPTISIYQLY